MGSDAIPISIEGNEKYRSSLGAFTVPLTARQLSRKVGISLSAGKGVLRAFRRYELVTCLNSGARTNRVHWLTKRGQTIQAQMAPERAKEAVFESTDWDLLGWSSFRRRGAVIRVLTEPMAPPAVRRRIVDRFPGVKMNVDKTRSVLKELQARGLARSVPQRKRAYSAYELTDLGIRIRRLLLETSM